VFEIALEPFDRIASGAQALREVGFSVLRNTKLAAQLAIRRHCRAGEPAERGEQKSVTRGITQQRHDVGHRACVRRNDVGRNQRPAGREQTPPEREQALELGR